MSQIVQRLDDGRAVVFGNDPSFNTLFAQLFAPGDVDDPGAKPVEALGYHPAEQLLEPGPRYGPYPADLGDLDAALIEWGVDGDTREDIGRRLAAEG